MATPLRPEDLFSLWQRDSWSSVYLFAGQEDYLIEQALHRALLHWLPDDKDGLNLDRFDGEKDGAEKILQACQTIPFLGNCRVVRVDNAAELSAADQARLAAALEKLSPETRLLLLWGNEWRREEAKKPLVEAAASHGKVVIFWPLFPEQAQRWLLQRAKHYKKELSEEAASWLLQNSGESLRRLDQELAKVSVFVGQRPQVDVEDVQSSFGYEKLSSPFNWVTAIRQKNSQTAARLLHRLLKDGEEPLRLMALISRSLRDWLSAKHSNAGTAVLAMRFHLKRGEENSFLKDLGRWSESDLINALDACLNAEDSIKSGKETPEMSLTLLTLSLCGLQTADTLR